MSDKRTAVLVVMDGLGDRPLKELGDKTPLDAARTPTFDRLTAEGQSGLMNVIGPGQTPGSDTAHLALFGYDPVADYPGRGPLEAFGAGLATKPGDVAFRSNFATVDSNMVVLDRRAGREFSPEEQAELQGAIDGLVIDDVTVHFIATVEHRGALVLEGEGLYADITDVDPHETGKKILTAKALKPEAEKTAKVVNKLMQVAHEKMKDLETNKRRAKKGMPLANALLLRGPGRHSDVPPLPERYGIKAAVLAGGALYLGAAKYVGMEHIPVEGQTGTIDTNFDNIAAKAIETIQKDYNYVFIHIKATDNASHDGNAQEKILAIERTDAMLKKIVDKVGDKLVIAVVGDHSTPVSVKEHACDPVPILLWSNFIRPDSVKKYSEADTANGSLHTIRGLDVMPLLLGYSGYIPKFGE
jgi:2,3-bisphosphoglycerate-independent phosphoglycerate mutase